MKKRITILSVLILLAMFAAVAGATQSSLAFVFGNTPSANGHGNLTVGGELRTFSFHANTRKDGTVKGSATLHNRASDVFIHADIDCLSVVGNIATMSGTITNSSDPAFEGRRGLFQVQDNGEGGNTTPDQISLLVIFPANSTIDCNSNFTFSRAPIEGGNIQVKP
jgi:hypothetical protein